MYYVDFVLLELGNAGFSIICQVKLTEVTLTTCEPLCQLSAVSAPMQPVFTSCVCHVTFFFLVEVLTMWLHAC
jgi:hypothetical protein